MAKPTTTTKVDPGVFLTYDDPEAILGEGWYYYNSPANQTFASHAGQSDFYIYDFAFDFENPRGISYVNVGKDTVDTFEFGSIAFAGDYLYVVNGQGYETEYNDPDNPDVATGFYSKYENYDMIQKKGYYESNGFTASFFGGEQQVSYDGLGGVTYGPEYITTRLGSFTAKSTVGNFEVIG